MSSPAAPGFLINLFLRMWIYLSQLICLIEFFEEKERKLATIQLNYYYYCLQVLFIANVCIYYFPVSIYPLFLQQINRIENIKRRFQSHTFGEIFIFRAAMTNYSFGFGSSFYNNNQLGFFEPKLIIAHAAHLPLTGWVLIPYISCPK